MCSFDVVSLFTNVPLEKTIEICAEALYHDDEVEPVCTTLSEKSFCDLLRMVTSGVEFSFDNKMYLQKDGVAMGSPLGPALADIFVGWCESHIPEDAWPATYCRFVDDAFSFFERFQDIDQFLEILNNLHPALKFTCEHENEDQLPYLDVLVEKNTANRSISTSVYRKPTFTGLYNTWDSFCATKYKINTVKNLVQRAHRICSPSKLDQELEKLRSIFTTNGYPLDLLAHLVKRKQEQDRPMGPKRCPVYLRLPWKGPWSSAIARTIGQTAQAAYNAVNVNCVYTTSRAFNLRKDVLPSHSLSNLIYQFECRHCASRYVGRTAQRLSSRLRQHVPLNILVTDEARALRPKRGRPPANPTTGETPTSADTACTVVGAAESNVSATQSDCAKEDRDSVGTGSATTHAMASDDHVGTDADNQFQRTRPYLPRRCKGTKMMTSSVNSKSSSRSLEPMTSPEDLSSQTGKSTDASDGLTLRVSLPRACKKVIVAEKSTATPSARKSQEEGVEEDEEEPGEEKNKKSPDDYQSAVARHLLENEACLRAYTDNSFCIVCVCSSKYLSLDEMEALFIRSLSPNLCVQKSSVTSLQLFRSS